MTHKMLILGAGKMAKAIAYDFEKQKDIIEITIASRKLEGPKRIIKFLKSKKTKTTKLDLNNFKQTVNLMKKYDCCVSAAPYDYNYILAKAAIKAKCNFIDLGGNNEIVRKEFTLSSQAKKNKIAIIPDCGLAPGLVSDLTALGLKEIKKPESIKLRVGGLPKHPKPPLNYMIVFSVHGLINEYIEPVEVIKNYKLKKIKPMQDIEKIYFPEFGQMEAFNTSGGTSTLPESFKGKIKTLNYKTIRYSGHAEKIKLLMDLGLTSDKFLDVEGVKVQPRELLEKLFLEKFSYKDKDLVLLRVILENRKKRITYELIDYEKAGLTAMMRCTGFPAAVIAEMIVRNQITNKGTLKHEFDISPGILIDELKKRGLNIVKKTTYKK